MKKLQHSHVVNNGVYEWSTATVGDMMDFLSQFGTDVPLFAEWEGQVKEIGDPRQVDDSGIVFDVEYGNPRPLVTHKEEYPRNRPKKPQG